MHNKQEDDACHERALNDAAERAAERVERANALPTDTKIKPCVNLNGTSVDALVEQQSLALGEVDCAINALCDAAPHGRDYQIGDIKYEEARAEFDAEIVALRKIRQRIVLTLDHLQPGVW